MIYLQRILTIAEMNALKQKRNLNSFLIKGLFLSSDYSIIQGRFEYQHIKQNTFKTNYILDMDYSYYSVPSSMLHTFHCEIDGRFQYGFLKVPYTVKVGDKIIFV